MTDTYGSPDGVLQRDHHIRGLACRLVQVFFYTESCLQVYNSQAAQRCMISLNRLPKAFMFIMVSLYNLQYGYTYCSNLMGATCS